MCKPPIRYPTVRPAFSSHKIRIAKLRISCLHRLVLSHQALQQTRLPACQQMQMGGCAAEDVSPGGGLRVPLPTAKDALVTMSLKDGNGGCKLFKSHVGTLAKHSELFAAAMRQGTKLKVAPLAWLDV